jgi:hypothetical protein
MNEIIVMFNSNEAAQHRTNLSGWVSRNGRYYGSDERAARYDGCTHVTCEDCGQPVERGRLICSDCEEKRDIKKYNSLPKEVWNEEGGIYSDAIDEYFWSWDEVEDYCGDEGIEEGDLRLIICVPQYLPLLDSSDFGCDELPEDGELPNRVINAIEDLNRVIKESGPVSWLPGNKAAIRKLV